jgi:segregation and condensation protein A
MKPSFPFVAGPQSTALQPEDPKLESPQQPAQLALATVDGQPWLESPKDLYIPPDAMEVFLERFEGPLDLLLYLIRKQKLDIVQMPLLEITRQYMDYVEAMKALNLELAADYLVMAALLTEIKSRMLLPKPEIEAEELDPRAELIRRLQQYELYKNASEKLDVLPRLERDHFLASAAAPEVEKPIVTGPDVSVQDLLDAMRGILERASQFEHHAIKSEQLSTRQRMSEILDQLSPGVLTPFTALFTPEEGRRGAVVSFLAILELTKGQLIRCVQSAPLSDIWVTPYGSEHESDETTES